MRCVLAHCLGVEGVKGRKLLWLLLLPRAGRPPRAAPPGLAARSGRRGGGPPRGLRRHRGLRALQRRAGGGLRLRVAADPVDGRTGVLPRPQALASRQGLTLGATPTNTGGCMEYKCPRCMARFAKMPGPKNATGARPPQSLRP